MAATTPSTGTFRRECFNPEVFASLIEARIVNERGDAVTMNGVPTALSITSRQKWCILNGVKSENLTIQVAVRWEQLRDRIPVTDSHVLTDNGSEFARYFARELAEQDLCHFINLPRTNARIERLNRTIQDNFIDYQETVLFTGSLVFNDALFGLSVLVQC